MLVRGIAPLVPWGDPQASRDPQASAGTTGNHTYYADPIAPITFDVMSWVRLPFHSNCRVIACACRFRESAVPVDPKGRPFDLRLLVRPPLLRLRAFRLTD